MALQVRRNENRLSNARNFAVKRGESSVCRTLKRLDQADQTDGKDNKRHIEEEEKRVQDLPVVPEGVVDIDATEEGLRNPQLCYEYTPHLFAYLRHVENELSIRKDFLQGFHINERIRSMLVDWLVDVHNQFKFLQETLYLTIYMLDKFTQLDGVNIKRSKYQLVGVTAMFTASKVEEMYPLEIRDFVYITENTYSAAEIRQMELRMLKLLKFGLGRPLPLHFLRRYSKAGDVDILQHTLAKYVIELCQIEYEMAHLKPSFLSAAALYFALLVLRPEGGGAVWNRNLEYYSSYTSQDLDTVVTKIATIVEKAPNSKYKAVYKKFSEKSRLRVSRLEELKGERLKRLMRD